MGAKNLPDFAVHVDEIFRSSGFVQRINVLRDDGDAWLFPFKTSECRVCRVGFALRVRAAAHVVEIVHETGIGFEGFGCGDVAPIVFGPYAGGIAEGRQSAFGG